MTSLNKTMEIGSWTDVINLVIVAATLLYNGYKNRKSFKRENEEKRYLIKLKNKSTWFNRIVLDKLSEFDNIFENLETIFIEYKQKDKKEKIIERRKYQEIRREIRHLILPIKGYDKDLFDKLSNLFEAYENKIFLSNSIQVEELNEYHVYFTMTLIKYEENDYKV
ncbi:MAG: hypothetical protein RSE17_02260 [Bacilli bacterium]